jgi:hypothetical protein
LTECRDWALWAQALKVSVEAEAQSLEAGSGAPSLPNLMQTNPWRLVPPVFEL